MAWQNFVISATGDDNYPCVSEGGFILRVEDASSFWANAEKIAIPSLPYQLNGSTAGAQTTFGSSNWPNGAVLYALQCPADANTTVKAVLVSAEIYSCSCRGRVDTLQALTDLVYILHSVYRQFLCYVLHECVQGGGWGALSAGSG